jgi:hypothetical protein
MILAFKRRFGKLLAAWGYTMVRLGGAGRPARDSTVLFFDPNYVMLNALDDDIEGGLGHSPQRAELEL